MYGSVGVRNDARSITAIPPIGSMIPLRLPMIKDFVLLLPSALMGMDMIAPSGMFWMAIPNDIAMAPAIDISIWFYIAPARTAPTAMPSGRLCIVTARESMAVRDILDRGPSGLLRPM